MRLGTSKDLEQTVRLCVSMHIVFSAFECLSEAKEIAVGKEIPERTLRAAHTFYIASLKQKNTFWEVSLI